MNNSGQTQNFVWFLKKNSVSLQIKQNFVSINNATFIRNVQIFDSQSYLNKENIK